MPFLDGFAQAFSGTYGAVSSRRSERERTAAQSEHWRAEEEVARGALDIDRSAEARAVADAPSIKSAREAEAALNRANAGLVAEQTVTEAYQNTDEFRQAVADKLAADTSLNTAQGRAFAAQAALDEFKMSDEGKERIRQEAAAAVRKSDAEAAQAAGAGAASQATAEQTGIANELSRAGPGLRGTLNAHSLMQKYFGSGVSVEDTQNYMRTGELPTPAIPEGETAPEPEGVTATGRPTTPPEYTEAAPPPAPSRAVPAPVAAPVPAPITSPTGPVAGPAVRPGAIPYTAGTRAEAPISPTAGPLPNTYRAGAETAPPPRAGEPRLPTPQRPEEFDDRRNNVMGVEKTSYQGGGQGNVIEAQGGTRRLPLNERTRGMLEQASAATGLDVRVTSGAQPSSGTNRVGSHRHDIDVGSGDVQLIDRATGKPVSMATAEGQQRIIEFMRAARDAGATGFGAGPDYMGNTTIHVGFGSPSVWGAGGKAANAPGWLTAGMQGGGGGRPSTTPEGAGVRPGVQGERVASEAIPGKRMPTPRGEVKSNVNRQLLVQNSLVAAKEGAKFAVQQAGLGGPTPAITDAGRTARQRGFISGEGAASSKEMANAKEAVQKALPGPVSDTEMNLLTMASAYDWYLNVEGDPEKAKAVAAEIYQSYKRSNAQYMSVAQALAQGGDLDKAAKMAAKAYAFIPDGQEASFTKKGDDILVTIKDLATDTVKVEQLLTPDQMYSQLMGWQGPIEFDRAMLRAAGGTVPSRSAEAGQQQLASPIEPPSVVATGSNPAEVFERQAIPSATPIDTTQMPLSERMTDEEQGRYQTGLGARNTQIQQANIAAQRPDLATRENIDLQLEKIKAFEDDPSTYPEMSANVEALRGVYGNSLNSIFANMLQYNPTEVAETVVQDLANAIQPTTATNEMPMQAQRGDYEGTWKVKFTGSPTEYNIPSETALAIRNGIQGTQSKAGQLFTQEAGREARELPGKRREAQDAAAARARFEEERRTGTGRMVPVRPQQRPAGPVPRATPPLPPVAPIVRPPPTMGPYLYEQYTPTARGPAIPMRR